MIYIGDYLVDADAAMPPVVVREPAPLTDIESRSGDYTKTFRIAGNDAANKAFSHYFDVRHYVTNNTSTQYNPDYNPNKKAPIRIWDNGDILFDGFCKLDSIIVENGKVLYEVSAFTGLSQFTDKLGELRLKDLDMSAYNHAFTEANVSGSWTNDYTDGYVYPAVTYGDKTDLSYWKWTDFKPAVFLKAVWDKIFSTAGWSYESNFLSTSHFEKLIFANPNWLVSRDYDTVNDLTFTVGNGSAFTATNSADLSSAPTVASRLEFPTATGSILNNTLQNTATTEWDTTNFLYTADNDCSMAFRLFVDGSVEYTGASTWPSFGSNFYMRLRFSVVRVRSGVSKIIDYISGFAQFSSGLTTSGTADLVNAINWTFSNNEIEAGDEIYIAFTHAELGQFQTVSPYSFNVISKIANGDVTFTADTGSLFGNIIDTNISIGQTMFVSRVLPDMTQKEFIKGLANMFNLYFELSDDSKLLIEPREDYYLSTVVDWDDKLDLSQEYIVKPVSELDYRSIEFTYKKDDAKWNSTYRESWGYEYGSKKHYVDTDYQTTNKKIELPFASCALVDWSNKHDMVVSDISFFGDDGKPTLAEEPAPRVLYYGGLVTCKGYLYDDGTTLSIETTYPYAGHLDDPVTPEFDYLFFQPRNIYYTRMYGGVDYPQYPNGNLYNKYYYRHVYEISSPNSRTLEGYFALTKQDYKELSFRNKYYIMGQHWRLIGVYDYDLSGKSLTQCKFLLTDDATDPTLDAYKLNTGYGETDDQGDPLPRMMRPPKSNGNTFIEKEYYGLRNDVGGTMGQVYGDDNSVSSSVRGFGLHNSSGNDIHSLGAFLVNTNDREVLSDNEVWVNNVNLERYVEVTMDYSFVQSLGSGVDILPSLESNQYYEVTRGTLKYTYNSTSYVTGSTSIKVETSDGAAYLAEQADAPLSGTADQELLFVTRNEAVRDLSTRLGLGLRLKTGLSITGNGGTVVIRIYYKVVEI